MRIAVVVNAFPQISETFIVRQSKALEAYVVTGAFNEDVKGHYDFDYEMVFPLGSQNGWDTGFFQKTINRINGVTVKLWPKSFKQKFSQFLKEKRIDVVLAEFGPNGINVSEICQKLGIPFVVQFLGYDASSLLTSTWYQKAIVKVVKASNKCIVLYEGMQEKLIEIGCDPTKFTSINIGVPVSNFVPVEFDFSGTFNFIFVGRLVAKKAPLKTLMAFERCAAKHPKVFLNVIGDGALMEQVRSFVEKSEFKERIKLWGALPQKELKKIYKNSHVFLQHSITAKDGNKEGWPVSIAEACSYGLPVVSTEHAGIVEQVIHGQTGFLVPENDDAAMGDFMLELANNHEKCIEMGEAAREHITSHGDLPQQIEKLKNVLAIASNS